MTLPITSSQPESGPVEPSFTAAQIACALGRSRQAIAQRLALTPSDAVAIISGQESAAWHLQSLPPELRADLDAAAPRQFYRDALHMLTSPGEQWRTPVPLDQVRPVDLAKATKLRTALESTLQRLDDPAISPAQRLLAGLAEYKKAFGHGISIRQWWRLVDRTVNRDRGQKNWMRLELYLAKNIGQVKTGPRIHPARLSHDILSDTIKQFSNPAKPTAEDRAFFFRDAFEHFETLLAENPDRPAQRLVKNSLLDWIFNAVPSLAKTPKSLRRVFEIKLNLWRAGERTIDALEDRRTLDSGNFCREDFSEDKKKLRNRSVLLDGNVSRAFLELWQEGAFTQAFVEHYTFDPRINKSNVPGSVRKAVTPEVEAMIPYHHGPRVATLGGPSIMRDYAQTAPGDWFSADDWTPEIYFWTNDENGTPQIMRGECLVFIDVRSRYPLAFRLIAGKYNSEHIRGTILRVHDVHGLPHKGFHFENGVWRGDLVEGIGRGALGLRETERGLDGFGLRVRRTYLPRGKIIEGVFNVLQNSLRDLPGYCGPNEQVQKMERLQKFMAESRAGNVHPGEQLFEMAQWREMLDKALMAYAEEPQNGSMLDGLSPVEMWKKRGHLRQLPPEGRYILATHETETTVRSDGIWITIRGQRRNYYNKHTGEWIGRRVRAFYNVEQPDLLTWCDMKKTTFFAAEHRKLPAFDATPEQFAAVNADRNAHMRYVRTEYDQIVHPGHKYLVHDNSIDETERKFGELHNAAVAAHRDAQAKTTRKLRKIGSVSAALGLPVPHNVRNADRVQKGLELIADAQARLDRREQQSNVENT